MRKHFLLLFLLTLLPLAGWAADFKTDATVTVDDIYFGLNLKKTDAGSYVTVKINTNELAEGTDYNLDQTSGKVNFYNSESCTTKVSLVSGQLTPIPGTYWVKIVPANNDNSNWAAGKVIVKPMPLKVTVSNASKTFNNKGKDDAAENLGTITKVEQKVKNDAADVYSTEITGTALTAIKKLLTVSRIDGKNAANYDYTVTSADNCYSIGDVEGKFTINPKALPSRGTTGNSILVTVTNYSKTFNAVGQKATVTIKDNALNYTFDTKDFSVTYGNDEVAYSATQTNVGTYTIKITPKRNYSGDAITLTAANDKQLTIAQKALQVYVQDLTKVYDGTVSIPNTAIISYSGLEGADATKALPFGDIYNVDYVAASDDHKYVTADNEGYPLLPVPNGTTPGGNYDNYKITRLSTGTLKVTPRPVLLSAVANQKSFGSNDPALTFTIQDFDAEKEEGAFDDDKVAINAFYECVRPGKGTDEAVDTYEKALEVQKKSTVTGVTAEVLAQYTKQLAQYAISTAAADFVIKAASLTVYPKSKIITYGDEYTIDDFEVIATNSGNTKVTLTTVPAVQIVGYEEGDLPKNAGIYTLKLVGTAAAAGYGDEPIFLESQFTIKPKELTITPKAQTLHIGDTKADLATYNIDDNKVTFTGLVKGDKINYELDFNTTDERPLLGRIPTFNAAASEEVADEAAVNAYNLQLDDAIQPGTTLNDEQAEAVNEALELTGDDAYTASGVISEEDAVAYNETLDGKIVPNKLTADQAAAVNSALALEEENAKAEGDVITSVLSNAYNLTRPDAIEPETPLTADQAAAVNSALELTGEDVYTASDEISEEDANAYNATLTEEGAITAGTALSAEQAEAVNEALDLEDDDAYTASGVISEAHANAYNATLTEAGAIPAGTALTPEQAAAVNDALELTGDAVYSESDVISEVHANAYNAKLDDAIQPETTLSAAQAAAVNTALGLEEENAYSTKGTISEDHANAYNLQLDDAIQPETTLSAVQAEAVNEALELDEENAYSTKGTISEDDAYAYNETLTNAIKPNRLTEEQAEFLNEKYSLTGENAYKEGDDITAEVSKLYNLKLEGAIAEETPLTAEQAEAVNTALALDEENAYSTKGTISDADAFEYNATRLGAIHVGDPALEKAVKGINEDGELLVDAVYAHGIKINIIDDDDDDFANNNYIITVDGKTAVLTVVPATTFVLDDTDIDLASKIEDADGATDQTITFSSRILKAGQWNTLVLPFATTVPEISKKLGYAVVDVLNEANTNESNVSLVLAFGALPANKPFLVQPAEDKNLNTVTFENKKIEYSAEPVAEDAANHSLIGVYTMGKKVSSADKTEYYYNVTEKKFVNGGTKGTAINPMRAYLKDNSTVGVRTFTIEEPNGQTTVITNVNTEAEFNTNEVYDIRGMKMQGVPTEKGIYIINGKKVVIK